MTHISVGTLVVALAALNYNGERKRNKARNAFLVLRCLVSSKSLPTTDTADNIATLLRLQGLSRISGLLCPVLHPTAASADDLQEGVLPLVFLVHFVGLETPIMLWHVKWVVCLSGQRMQLCSSAEDS